MKWAKRILAGSLVLLMVAMTAAYLTPLDTYLPGLERAVREQLREPVSIRHLRVAVLPLPHLELQGVRLGEADEVVVRSVKVEPDLTALLAGEVVVRRILVQDGTANLAQLRKLAGLFGNASAMALPVRELQLSGINVATPGEIIGPVEGKLDFTQNGKLERIWLGMDEQKMTVILLPRPDRHFALKMQAKNWISPKLTQFPIFSQIRLDDFQVEGVLGEQDFVVQDFAVALRGVRMAASGKVEFSDGWQVQLALSQMDAQLERLMELLAKPVELTGAVYAKGSFGAKADNFAGLKENFQFSGEVMIRHATARIAAGLRHPLVFDQIKAFVAVNPKHLELNALEARLYGGKLSGTMSINRKNTVLTAKLAAKGIAMQPLVEALTNEVLFTGGMDGAVKLTMRLDAFEQFPKNTQLTGDFHLRDGLLSKVDLLKAASSKNSIAGGETRFDDMTGLLVVDANGYHFRKLKIVSGSLNAEGKMDIDPSLQLDGVLDTEVKGTAGLVSMPIAVSGTLNEPVIRPSGSTLVGAALGTAILGPGLGTAVGIKVGGFLHKLFGKNDDKSGKPASYPSARK